jgi:hypothetical protein
VSATDLRKYDDPPGLQDNWEIAFNFLAGVLVGKNTAAEVAPLLIASDS